MLAHILALVVGLVSFALYLSAFFFPEVYRKSDLTWSGVGLFYALVLWLCAGRITGGVLLGQTASVALLGWLGWQTINLRRELTPASLRTPLPNDTKTIAQAAQFKLGQLRSRWQQTPLARQTDRLAGTIAGWTGSVAKPKKQPPAIGRSRSLGTDLRPVGKTNSRSAAGTDMQSTSSPIAVPADSSSEPAANISAVVSEPSAPIEPAISESAAAVESPVEPVRPARPSRNLFSGFRRNAPKPKAAKKRSTPPPAPALDLDEIEAWDEEAIETAFNEPAVRPEFETNGIEDVVVVVETDDPATIEVIEIEVVEDASLADDAIVMEVVSVEVVESAPEQAEEAIEPESNWQDDDLPPETVRQADEASAIEPPLEESPAAAPEESPQG